MNALVGETNDGGLNDIRGLHVTRDTCWTRSAPRKQDLFRRRGRRRHGDDVLGWKGGIGTSSPKTNDDYTVGVLAQTNFGGNLTIAGVPVFRLLQPPRRQQADAGSPRQAQDERGAEQR